MVLELSKIESDLEYLINDQLSNAPLESLDDIHCYCLALQTILDPNAHSMPHIEGKLLKHVETVQDMVSNPNLYAVSEHVALATQIFQNKIRATIDNLQAKDLQSQGQILRETKERQQLQLTAQRKMEKQKPPQPDDVRCSVTNEELTQYNRQFIGAAVRGNIELMQSLLRYRPIDINDVKAIGFSALYAATYEGKFEVVQFLVENGANLECVSEKRHCTPLHSACMAHGKKAGKDFEKVKLAIVNFLLEKNANIDARSSKNYTPSHIAACYGFTDILLSLLRYRANVMLQSKNKNIPLHEAIRHGRIDIVRILSECSDVNAQNGIGATPLHQAVFFRKVEIVRFLVQLRRINVNAQDSRGDTPTHLALLIIKDDSIARILLESKKVDLDVVNSDGISIRDILPSDGK